MPAAVEYGALLGVVIVLTGAGNFIGTGGCWQVCGVGGGGVGGLEVARGG